MKQPLSSLAALLLCAMSSTACEEHASLPEEVLVRHGWSVYATPARPLNALSTVTQLHIDGLDAALKVPELQLLPVSQAAASPSMGRSETGSSTAVPMRRWFGYGDTLTLAPSQALAPGASYLLAAADDTPLLSLTVAASGLPAVVPLVWPPGGHGARVHTAIWCATDSDTVLPPRRFPQTAFLPPHNVASELVRGAGSLGGFAHCVQLRVAHNRHSWLQPPQQYAHDSHEPAALLQPVPLGADEPLPPTEQLSCEGEWRAAASGCLRTIGDRLHLQTPPQPLLWLLRLTAKSSPADDRASEHVVPMKGDTITLELPPIDVLSVRIETIDLSGARSHAELIIDRAASEPPGDTEVYD